MERYVVYIGFVAIIGFFYFAVMRPQSKQRKAHQELMSTLKKGDLVRTHGGVFGKVARVDDTVVVVEIAKGVTMKMLRGAVAEIIRDKEKMKTYGLEGVSTTAAKTSRKAKDGSSEEAVEGEVVADSEDGSAES